MNRVKEAQRFIRDAEVLRVVTNSKRPELDGTRRRITKVGASYFEAVLLDPVEGKHEAGISFRGQIPTRARDVLHVSEEHAMFALGDGHTISFERVS